eukprot:scaffold259460_cov30-Tisochrysis_lutea.AAC.2
MYDIDLGLAHLISWKLRGVSRGAFGACAITSCHPCAIIRPFPELRCCTSALSISRISLRGRRS